MSHLNTEILHALLRYETMIAHPRTKMIAPKAWYAIRQRLLRALDVTPILSSRWGAISDRAQVALARENEAIALRYASRYWRPDLPPIGEVIGWRRGMSLPV